MSRVERPLLERGTELAALTAAVRQAGEGRGCLALISGEAGIGKSSLVAELRDRLPARTRVLVGHCDDLATPRALGPIRDLARAAGAELTRLGDRETVLAELHARLSLSGTATVAVVEDVHWADEASLDVLRYLARRITGLPVLLVLTYRDDPVSREPLQRLLGQVAADTPVCRLALRPLSRTAVQQLTAGSGVDPDRLHAMTSGNPFFVTAVLAHGDGERVPHTVVDAV